MKFGIISGLAVATLFSAIVITRWVINHNDLARIGLTLPQAILGYYVGGVGGGAIMGGLSFLGKRSNVAAFLIGTLGMLPFGFMTIRFMNQGWEWTLSTVGATIIGAMVLGGCLGLIMWRMER